MKRTIIKIISFLKGIIIFIRPHVYLGWLKHPLLTLSNLISLSKWIAVHGRAKWLNDFYTPRKDYSKRYQVYQILTEKLQLKTDAVDYLEFGVSGGYSFRWWLKNSVNQESRFYGFDTFEGLPENWGAFGKGEMAANIPVIDDSRAEFIKGLFQDTVPGFLSRDLFSNGKRKIIHLDADLFSSTLYTLTTLAPYLKKGDILMFDEFNVPNHEFFAFKMFSDSFYLKTTLLAAVNNYYQIALMVE